MYITYYVKKEHREEIARTSDYRDCLDNHFNFVASLDKIPTMLDALYTCFNKEETEYVETIDTEEGEIARQKRLIRREEIRRTHTVIADLRICYENTPFVVLSESEDKTIYAHFGLFHEDYEDKPTNSQTIFIQSDKGELSEHYVDMTDVSTEDPVAYVDAFYSKIEPVLELMKSL